MRALVLGTQSFIDGGTKVGSQYLAEALASDGWQVDYVPTLSSPLDVVGGGRHARLVRAWGGGAAHPLVPRLVEWSVRAPFPAHRWFMRGAWQLDAYGCLMPRTLRHSVYDVCLADVAPNLLLLPHVRARAFVCRLNDWPHGFAQDLHPVVLGALEDALRSTRFEEIWAVSQPLADYARALAPRGRVIHLPNGVDAALLSASASTAVRSERRARSAVYVGGMTAWLDRALLAAVARRMPEWAFDIYGPGGAAASDDPPNLHWRGSVRREELPSVLQRYEVGLIPFRDAAGRLQFVERPLKFYEYIAAGLGVASTDFGALRQGMQELASYGNGADAFALAIESARAQGATRTEGFAASFVRENGWPARAQAMRLRLEELLA